jgi:glycosyltransferase involved in cell wall biosynthesis
MTPLVSVGIPTYNGAKYLRESVESVLAQTFRDFELVLIDDLSSDKTWIIAEEYARKDPRVSAVRNNGRLGLAANFNRCIESTKGRYICVWHQDDVMMPQNIEYKVALLEANPQVGFVHSNVLMIDDQGQVLSEHWELDSRQGYVCAGREFFLKMIQPGKNYVCCPSVLARRECYDKLGYFRKELFFTCDWEMWMRLSLYYDVGCLGAPLIHFRRHTGSESYRIEGTIAEIEQELLAKHLVLVDHGKRVPHAAKHEENIVVGLARGQLVQARRAFSEGRVEEAWSRLRFGVKLYPPLAWRPESAGTLVRLLLGPATCRWIKSTLLKEKPLRPR